MTFYRSAIVMREFKVEQMTVQDTGIQIEGVLHIRFMYVRPDDQIPFALWQGMIPFSWLLESNEVQEDMTLDMMPSLEQLGHQSPWKWRDRK